MSLNNGGQLDLFLDTEEFPINTNKSQHLTDITVGVQLDVNKNLINSKKVFLSNKLVKFFDLEFNEDKDNFFITFLINKNNSEAEDYKNLNITITVNKNNKYNNILITHGEIKEIAMKLEILKYFMTGEGFHKLMKEILSQDNIPKGLLNIEYNHQKYGKSKDFDIKEEKKYKGEKLILGKVGLSPNYFPDLYILKDNSSTKFNKNNFDFKIEIELDKKRYIIEGNGLRTINNSGNFEENIINVDINNYTISSDNNFSDELIRQIKSHIVCYIQEL